MSHIVQIQTQVRDLAAIEAACQRLNLPRPRSGAVELFSAVAEGVLVELPGWKYPVVCSLATGELRFDDYEGAWGKREELDRFLQAYAVERAKAVARRQGYGVIEEPLADGSIKLLVQVTGDAA